MQTKLVKGFFLLIFSILVVGAWALVSDYTFSDTAGTYTEISGGEVLLDAPPSPVNPVFNEIELGFDFVYDEITYTTVSIAENGFLAMGDEVATSNLPLSAANGTDNVVAALSRDIRPGDDDGELSYITQGTAPNRVFIAQWKNFRRTPTAAANDVLNFQIQLHEGTNNVVFSYGSFDPVTAATAATVQVGLRGGSNLDFNNRTTTEDWANTVAGSAANNSCTLSATVYPAEGLSFTFSPVQAGTPPQPAQSPIPANNALNVNPNTALSWASGGGAPTGYKVFLGTDNPPTNLVNGASQEGTSYQPAAALNFETQYYWQIVPFNDDGDAENCPIWAFSTWEDPTISSYPYSENFDAVTAPALPLGWSTINANNDNYTWESFVDNIAHTSPNVMRIRYNTSMDMDDWLISPPFQVIEDYFYKITFYYRANSATYPEKLSLYAGTAPTVDALTELVWTNDNITNDTYQMAQIVMPSPLDGQVYLGFHGHSDADQFYLYIDSFEVNEFLEELHPPTNFAANVSGRTVNLSWNAPGGGNGGDVPDEGEWITWCNPAAYTNAIGTNSAAEFGVYHMFDAADLAAYQGENLYQIQFVPNHQACVYTMKVWTGGTASTPGQLIYSAVHENHVLNEWNVHTLSTPVPIPADRIWIGYDVDTQGGHPAGCDDGPMIDGKGNIMYFNEWTTLYQVAATLTYNWSIQGFVGSADGAKAVALSPIVDNVKSAPVGELSVTRIQPQRYTRDLLGYKVYRDGSLLTTINGASIVAYSDENLEPGNYSYTLTAFYDGGESEPVGPVAVEVLEEELNPPTNFAADVVGTNVHLSWTAPSGGSTPPVDGFWDDFESYPDFALEFDPWVLVDVDGSGTYGITNYEWPNVFSAMAYMIFNPSATTPPLASLEAHSGEKMAAAFASTQAVNNDWMMSPIISVEAGESLNFWARSYVADYGLERFKVGVSSGGTAPADFTIISGTAYVQAPVNWTEYNYDLSTYAGQDIRIAINCVSDDAFFFLVDDVSIGNHQASFAFNPIVDTPAISHSREVGVASPVAKTITRDLLGYKLYRDGQIISTINDAGITQYDDMNLELGTYSYTLTAFYDSGESEPAGPLNVTIVELDPPFDLAAEVERNTVNLEWTSPVPQLDGEWITWCNVDVLGNSIGTGSATQFDVAHMFDATDLAAYQGGSIAQMKFVPGFQNCVYTVKVWTGGTASAPGTLVYENVHENHVTGEWNLHILTTPVPVPSDRLWIGYHVNTQGGHPAGCDDGPMVPGKGNMMNFGGWTTLDELNEALTYNWSIQGFVAEGGTMKSISLNPIPEIPTVATGELGLTRFETKRNTRALTGYRVYRDGQQLAQISDPATTTYQDFEVPNGDYIYGVSAVYHEGESEMATVAVTVNLELADAFFEDGFEAYPDFALQFAPWSLLDQDNSDTYGITNYEWPNAYQPMAYMVFNPSATVPPLESVSAHGGNKMAASFAAVNGPNNDWLISPRVTLGTDSHVKFYAKSHTAQYGLERFRVGVSPLPTIIPQGFQYVSGPTHIEAPTNWTEYIYDISQHDGQSVYIAIRCISDDAFIFYVDDFSIHSEGGYVSNEDGVAPVYTTKLMGNYPNPFNPETTIRYSLKENMPVNIGIYNIKGQLVKTLVNENKAAGEHSIVWNGVDRNNRAVSSGMYFFKMNAGKYSSTKKMIMMK